MERPPLIWLKCANDSVQHATIVEQDEVLFLPVVWVHQLSAAAREHHHQGKGGERSKYVHSVR